MLMGGDIQQAFNELHKKANQSAINMAEHALYYCDTAQHCYMWQITDHAPLPNMTLEL